MKTGNIFLPLFLIFEFTISFSIFAQPESPDSTTYYIEIKDGAEVVGRIISETDSTISFKTLSGIEMLIPKSQILKREATTGDIVRGEYWFRDPNDTRTFFAPTARGLNGGDGYISDILIFFPSLSIGVTDYFSLLGGISLFPGGGYQYLYFAPKISPITVYSGDWRTDISAGALFIKIPMQKELTGISYIVGSVGTSRGLITFGFGNGFTGSEFAGDPIILLSGYLRTSKYAALISENWIFFGKQQNLHSLGIRYFGQRFAADFAFIKSFGEGRDAFFFPWLSVVYNF